MTAKIDRFLKDLPGLDRDAIEARLRELVADERAAAVEDLLVHNSDLITEEDLEVVDLRTLVEKVLEALEEEFAVCLDHRTKLDAPVVLAPRLETLLGLPPGYRLSGVP